MSRKRTLDSFFTKTLAPPPKKAHLDSKPLAFTPDANDPRKEPTAFSKHPTYPFPIPHFPPSIQEHLGFCPASEGRAINDQPDLDLLYFEPYIPSEIQSDVFNFLRSNLFFYRVSYTIKRGSVQTNINTPRFTTVFGVDETSFFAHRDERGGGGEESESTAVLVDKQTGLEVPKEKYKCAPRPIPHCLSTLRNLAEATTGEKFNFCLVNYYASGNDSISYHSDDERFLGKDPAIASFSLGARRDFLMRHKPVEPRRDGETVAQEVQDAVAKPLKLALASGDMVLMRGRTQANWLHSIPKRKGGECEKGRINITFRKALVKGGTENYYQYNVGAGDVYKWDDIGREMMLWRPPSDETKSGGN